jgi:hypothetical protein
MRVADADDNLHHLARCFNMRLGVPVEVFTDRFSKPSRARAPASRRDFHLGREQVVHHEGAHHASNVPTPFTKSGEGKRGHFIRAAGHANIQTTVRYLHLVTDDLADAINAAFSSG